MSCELITGSPGAGKTTYAVATRIVDEAARVIEIDGEKVQRRIVCAGVRGLVMEHERLPHILTGDKSAQSDIDRWNECNGSGEPVHARLPGDPPVDCVPMVQNWWLWCKPGDFIVVDEVQFLAARGMMGRKPPYWIQALEIHRHYGVDFLFITQHPGLVDSVIKALVNPHRHVRCVMGSSVCTVYTWDHASNPERFNLANKSVFVRRAKHYKLFHSTVAVIKPPTSGRSIFVVVPVLMVAVILGVVYFKGRFASAAPVAASSQASAGLVAGSGTTPAISGHLLPAGQHAPRAGWRALHPVVTGCVARGDECRCIGVEGRPVVLDHATCKTSAKGFDGLVIWEPRQALIPPLLGQSASSPAPSPLPVL